MVAAFLVVLTVVLTCRVHSSPGPCDEGASEIVLPQTHLQCRIQGLAVGPAASPWLCLRSCAAVSDEERLDEEAILV